jgi:hypothetical protein
MEDGMNLIRTEEFEHDGNTYEVRLYGSGWDFNVQAYLNGERANGYSYSVSLPTAIDLNIVSNLDATKLLVQHAKRDIIEDIWRQYVDAYVAGLKKTPEESLGCRSCGSRDILVSAVDERKLYECGQCGKVWYERRGMTNGWLVILDEITEGVEKKGSHETDASILLNTVFRPRDKTGLSFEDQLHNWAIQNRLKHQSLYRATGEVIRFWR